MELMLSKSTTYWFAYSLVALIVLIDTMSCVLNYVLLNGLTLSGLVGPHTMMQIYEHKIKQVFLGNGKNELCNRCNWNYS